MSRRVFWIVFLATLALTLGAKAAQQGWFTPRLPLELDGKPAVLFFNKTHGCECERFVYNNAEAQIRSWDAAMQVICIDMDRRPDLARQYQVMRAPTLILIDAEGGTVWKQDEGISDESPLDLDEAERQIEKLTQTP
jgi:hypothetical protein